MDVMSGLYRVGQYLHLVDPSASYEDYRTRKAHITKLKTKFRQNLSQLNTLQSICDTRILQSRDFDGFTGAYRNVVEAVQNQGEATIENLRDNGLMVSFQLAPAPHKCRLLVVAQDMYTADFVYPESFIGKSGNHCKNKDYYQLR